MTKKKTVATSGSEVATSIPKKKAAPVIASKAKQSEKKPAVKKPVIKKDPVDGEEKTVFNNQTPVKPAEPVTEKTVPVETTTPVTPSVVEQQIIMPEDLSCRVVVIPYLGKAAAGNELLMAVRSWEKYYEGLARIVVIGDLPDQLKGKVSHIPHRAESDNPQVDVAQKMAAAIASDLVPDTFIWSNDDIFLLCPLGIEDIAAKKCMTVPLSKRGTNGGTFRENANRTIAALNKAGIKEPKDYATHTPVVFEKEKLAKVLAEFKCTKEGHLVSSLYFNTQYPDARPISMNNMAGGTIVASVWKSNPDRNILQNVMDYKQYINCNSNGWPHVERHLLKLFPKKSKFEN